MIPERLVNECSAFFVDAAGAPVYRLLPCKGEGFRRVKIRKKRNHVNALETYFDTAFGGRFADMRLRSVVAHTKMPPTTDGMELFFIFPPNGYKLLYNPEVPDYYTYISALNDIIVPSPAAKDICTSLFNYVYKHGTVAEAAVSGSDVLIYNIAYYYAIRASLIDDYDKFLSM